MFFRLKVQQVGGFSREGGQDRKQEYKIRATEIGHIENIERELGKAGKP